MSGRTEGGARRWRRVTAAAFCYDSRGATGDGRPALPSLAATTEDPPLSAAPTSPPQGGRLENAAAGTAPRAPPHASAPAASQAARPKSISPLEGEMSGRTEGGARRWLRVHAAAFCHDPRGATGDGRLALPSLAATTEDPPLSAAPTSPPQGGRLENAAAARQPIRRPAIQHPPHRKAPAPGRVARGDAWRGVRGIRRRVWRRP